MEFGLHRKILQQESRLLGHAGTGRKEDPESSTPDLAITSNHVTKSNLEIYHGNLKISSIFYPLPQLASCSVAASSRQYQGCSGPGVPTPGWTSPCVGAHVTSGLASHLGTASVGSVTASLEKKKHSTESIAFSGQN